METVLSGVEPTESINTSQITEELSAIKDDFFVSTEARLELLASRLESSEGLSRQLTETQWGKTCNLAMSASALEDYLLNTQWRTETETDYPHQAEVLKDILLGFWDSKPEGYVDLATSTGKTLIISKLAEAFLAAGQRVLILAPTKVIAEQIVGNNNKGLVRFAPTIGEADIAKHYGGNKADETSPLVVSTYQSLNNFYKTDELGEFDVILADEAHKGLGLVTSDSLKNYSKHAVKIGFSATPDYGENKGLHQVFEQRYHKIGLREAIANDLVNPVQCLVYATDTELTELDNSPDFTQKELARLIDVKSRNDAATDFAKNFVADGRQGVIACLPGYDLAHARNLATELSQQMIYNQDHPEGRLVIAEAVGSHQKTVVQQDILRRFELGEIDVLTFVNIIGEGWDSDKASFLINACPTTSIVKATQMLGRIIRKKADGKSSIAVDLLDKTKGKRQATALHALGEETYQLQKLFARKNSEGEKRINPATYLRGILDSRLWKVLQKNSGKLIKDIYLDNSTNDGRDMDETEKSFMDSWPADIRKKYKELQKQLEAEGLGEHDGDSLQIPRRVIRSAERFRNEYFAKYNKEPSIYELHELFHRKYAHMGRILIDEYTLRLSDGLQDIDTVQTPEYLTHDPTSQIDNYITITTTVSKVLKPLAKEREWDVICRKYGIGIENGLEASLEEIARPHGVTRERIRQIQIGFQRKAVSDYRFIKHISESMDPTAIDHQAKDVKHNAYLKNDIVGWLNSERNNFSLLSGEYLKRHTKSVYIAGYQLAATLCEVTKELDRHNSFSLPLDGFMDKILQEIYGGDKIKNKNSLTGTKIIEAVNIELKKFLRSGRADKLISAELKNKAENQNRFKIEARFGHIPGNENYQAFMEGWFIPVLRQQKINVLEDVRQGLLDTKNASEEQKIIFDRENPDFYSA